MECRYGFQKNWMGNEYASEAAQNYIDILVYATYFIEILLSFR